MTKIAIPTLRQDAQVIGLVGMAHGVSHFFHLILAPLFPWLREAFNLSYAELGLLMTIFFMISGVGQALAGFLVDRTGARAVLFAGVALLGIAALTLSVAQSYTLLMLGAVLAGLGNSVFHPADFTLLNKRVSPARLGHAFSVHGISGNLGWVVAPIFLTSLAGVAGWRMALFAAAFIPLTLLIILFVFRDLLATPEPVQVATASGNQKNLTHPASDLFGFIRLPAMWMCFAFFFVAAMAVGGIQSFSASALRELYGMSLVWATAGYTSYMLASVGGMVWGGFLAAKTGRHDRIIAWSFAAAGCVSLLLSMGLVPALLAVVLMGVVGFGAGVAGPSRDLLIRAAAPKNATGRVYGVVYSGLDIGLAAAPLFFGMLMDANHPSWVFLLIGLLQFLAILTAINVGSNTARLAAKPQSA